VASRHKPRFTWDEAARIFGGRDALEDAIAGAVERGITNDETVKLWRKRVDGIPAGAFAYMLVEFWRPKISSGALSDPDTEEAVWHVRQISRQYGKDSPEWRAILSTLVACGAGTLTAEEDLKESDEYDMGD